MENEDSKSENKKQSRRKRRKPSNLRSEYERRQHDKKWLETHIWHAKRMKMINKWSYRLAKHCSDKGVRANYRFMKRGAIISVSYAILLLIIVTKNRIYFMLLKIEYISCYYQ